MMTSAPLLRLEDVSYRYPGASRDALHGVSLAISPGIFQAVLGPNGSGKTTLVRIALGALRPLSGSATIGDRPAHEWPRRELARVIGVVPQREDNLFPQRVRETVLLGRYPFLSLWGRERAEDHAAVDRALAACDATELADRWMWTLSGGEYQRARAGTTSPGAGRTGCLARSEARDGVVRAGAWARGRSAARRAHDHARSQPRRAFCRLAAPAE